MDSTNYSTMGVLGTVITGSGFSADCKLGTLLAIAPDGTYIPAVAKWSGYVGKNGCSIPDLASYVVGVLVSDVAVGSGLILCDGVITDIDIIRAMIPDAMTDDTGAYYLSTSKAGSAERGPGEDTDIVTYCFSHRRESNSPTATDKTSSSMVRTIVFRPTAPEYAGHSHHCVELSASWDILQNSEGQDCGSSAVLSKDTEAGKLLELSGSSVELLQNGTQVPSNYWSYELQEDGDYKITLHETIVLADDRFTLCGTTPFTAREPVVRGIRYGKTAEGLFKFSGLYGQLEMSLNPAVQVGNQFTGSAVLELTDTGIKTGSVVQEITAGPGIDVIQIGDGRFQIDNSNISKSHQDMLLCNLDGVILGSGALFTSYVFPANTTSSLYGTFRAPHTDAESQRGKINLLVRGSSSLASLALNCRVLTPPVIGDDTRVAGVVIPTAPTEVSLDITKAGTASSEAYCVVSDELTLGPDSLVMCKLSANVPSANIEVLSVSLTLV